MHRNKKAILKAIWIFLRHTLKNNSITQVYHTPPQTDWQHGSATDPGTSQQGKDTN